MFKKGDKNSKDNYRPVSILVNISKCLNNACDDEFTVSWNHVCKNFNMDLEKGICDLLIIMNETYFASFTEDNAPYVASKNLDDVIK